jgi:hypothetical protein
MERIRQSFAQQGLMHTLGASLESVEPYESAWTRTSAVIEARECPFPRNFLTSNNR